MISEQTEIPGTPARPAEPERMIEVHVLLKESTRDFLAGVAEQARVPFAISAGVVLQEGVDHLRQLEED